MFDCFTSSHSVYFEEALDTEFRKQYKGVIVNARGYGGYGHFAIRKPITFWFKLPKFIKKMFPYRWIMWKNDREKMYELCFDDPYKSIIIVADMKNHSYKQLTFDKETYEDLKENIPVFLEKIGFKFKVEKDDCCTTLIFD
jgi:hypothetical protein